MFKNRYRQFILPILTLVLLLASIAITINQRASIKHLTIRLKHACSVIDTLQKEASIDRANTCPGLTWHDIQKYQKRGLKNPVRSIRENLLHKPDLIPFKPTLGGKMHFFKEGIQILTDPWVLAYFEDGHKAGYLLLQYSVHPEGVISWKILDAQMK